MAANSLTKNRGHLVVEADNSNIVWVAGNVLLDLPNSASATGNSQMAAAAS
jgi:hypothetical protein